MQATPGGGCTLFARFHMISRVGLIGGSVGSGRERNLHFVTLVLLFRLYGIVAYHLGGLQTSNLALGGGAWTDANPRVRLTGRRFYSNQDCPRIGLVGVFCGWDCSPTTLVAYSICILVHGILGNPSDILL